MGIDRQKRINIRQTCRHVSSRSRMQHDKLRCLSSSGTMTLKRLCQQFTASIDQLRRERNALVNNTALKCTINAKHSLMAGRNLTEKL